MSEVKKIATRDSYGNALAELGTQFPTRSFLPVSALYMVVFPLFGFPAKAILIYKSPPLSRLVITNPITKK